MTLEEYIKDEANRAKFEKCETQEDIYALLAADGVVLPEAGDELNEDDLEDVAGGAIISPSVNITLWVIKNFSKLTKSIAGVASALAAGGEKLKSWFDKNKKNFTKLGLKF